MKLRAFLLIVVLFGPSVPATGSADAATASWSFEPPSFDFGVRLPGDGPTSPKDFELRNTGEISLTPSLVSVSNRGESAFRLAGNGCTHALAPGAGCTIEVTLDPSRGGRKEGTLTVETSGSAVSAATAQLLGSGGEPIVVIDPPTVTFDTVAIPSTMLPTGSRRTVTITNVGSADLKIASPGYKEEAAPFPARPNFFGSGAPVGPGLCALATVPPGGSCALNLEFRPEVPGTYRAELELEYTDREEEVPRMRQIIPLYGTAVAEGAPSPAPPPGPRPASLPTFVHRPPLRTKSRTATFVFSADSSQNGFSCRATRRGRFRPCTSPVHLHGLDPGPHVFSVYALGGDLQPGPIRIFHWRIVR